MQEITPVCVGENVGKSARTAGWAAEAAAQWLLLRRLLQQPTSWVAEAWRTAAGAIPLLALGCQGPRTRRARGAAGLQQQ
jgi:hypothetical protein